MDSPEVTINAIHTLIVESDNDELILPVSRTPTDDPMLMDKDGTRGEMLENMGEIYSGLPDRGNLAF